VAARRYRPGRTLIVFFLGIAVMYGLVALAGTWKPALGLDLQGGLRITLTATGNPTDENFEEARRIIDQRVNGSGVVEAEVTAQSGRYIVVEIPGSTENRRETEELVRRQAQLRFRLVACVEGGSDACATGSLPLGRAPLALDHKPGHKGDNKSDEPTETASPTDTARPTDTASPTETTTDAPEEEDPDGVRTAEDEIAWAASPDADSVALFNSLECTDSGTTVKTNAKGEQVPAPQTDDPDEPLVSCEVRDEGGVTKYLLSRSVIEGTELDDAGAGIPQGEVEWAVTLDIGNDKDKAHPKGSTGGEDDFETISSQLAGTGRQFAIVLDGQILSAPVMNDPIRDGRSQITGDFTEDSATNLANSLKFGALPIAFEKDVTTEDVGPSLAGDQLTAGLTAGGIGLGLVMLYCLLYYRGLGTVVVASLVVAASITYGMVLLLSEAAGFTLTLPGIAGLIIAVGITADSFIIYFERIRDEMREGKSMRVAVETGWVRARVTRIAASTVSLLSAVVLYLFATGAVKGFGFALGLSTLIDLAVLFWFTKPVVSWLAQFKTFNSGHRLSGLSPATLGLDAPTGTTATAGGNA
jgi:preprotein translocase subunit SecD